jgi:hypothetical protein
MFVQLGVAFFWITCNKYGAGTNIFNFTLISTNPSSSAITMTETRQGNISTEVDLMHSFL